jgi:hypothetical protein
MSEQIDPAQLAALSQFEQDALFSQFLSADEEKKKDMFEAVIRSSRRDNVASSSSNLPLRKEDTQAQAAALATGISSRETRQGVGTSTSPVRIFVGRNESICLWTLTDIMAANS